MASFTDADAYTTPFQLTKALHRDVYAAIDPISLSHLVTGKVVMVIGAGGRLDFAITKTWLEAGAKSVALVGRDTGKLENTAAELKVPHLVAAGDVANKDDVRAIFEETAKNLGTVDVVINAAGSMNVNGMIGQIEPLQWWRDHETNVKAVYNIAYYFIKTTGGKGTFINTVSLGASLLAPGLSSYSTAKIAAIKLAEYLDLEMPNLRTFSVHPGIVEASNGRGAIIGHFTPFSKDRQELTAAFTLYLQKPEADFLRGGFASVNWDVEEMEKHREEIMDRKLLKPRFVGANLGPEGHPWKQ